MTNKNSYNSLTNTLTLTKLGTAIDYQKLTTKINDLWVPFLYYKSTKNNGTMHVHLTHQQRHRHLQNLVDQTMKGTKVLTLGRVGSFNIVSGVIANIFTAWRHTDYSAKISCLLGMSVVVL